MLFFFVLVFYVGYNSLNVIQSNKNTGLKGRWRKMEEQEKSLLGSTMKETNHVY